MNQKKETTNWYGVIVIGAGHAGCEAAHAAAKMGVKTLLTTTSLDTIGLIACSPSFGGPGRGQLLREIDAMGGLMPKIIDRTAIHFRRSGKNSASWAPFAICDRSHYHRLLKVTLEKVDNLEIKQDTVEKIVPSSNKWDIETVSGQRFQSKSLVIAAGTFLKGRTLQGGQKQKAGRNNEMAADGLAAQLEQLGFKMGMFRTGTGPTVKLFLIPAGLEKQQYDSAPYFCSPSTRLKKLTQVLTYKTYTTAKTMDIIKKQQNNQLTGPRYCPSLADKVAKFPQKTAHPVFLQPESLDEQEWFLNGASMDLDEETQQKVVASIKGLSKAQIMKFGYSVSYCYLKSGQLMSNLESKKHPRLFFAGQVTGSNGYEEAAALGLIAGKNAVFKARKQSSPVLDRRNSFIGTLADDISSKTITEPYRMLLSRVISQDISADNLVIPNSIDFSIVGLSKEAVEKLDRFRPPTIKDALMLDIPEKSVRALALYLERISK